MTDKQDDNCDLSQNIAYDSPRDGVLEEEKPLFPVITMHELMNGDYSINFLCKGVLAEGQPAIIGGPHKAFKTSLGLNLAVCLTTGKQFLGTFDVPEPVRVCYFSGEGGLGVIQDTL